MRVSILLGTTDTDRAKIKSEVEFASLAELGQIICAEPWSPYLFQADHPDDPRYKHRLAKNMRQADVFAIDIDEGLTVDEAITRIEALGLQAIIGTSKSHMKEKKGKVTERFRIVFPLFEPLLVQSQVRPIFEQLKKHFPELDPQCKDAARFFYKCQEIVYMCDRGDRLMLEAVVPVKTDGAVDLSPATTNYPLSLKTLRFIKEGAPEGARNTPFIEAVHDAIQQQWEAKEFIGLLLREGQPWMVSQEYLGKLEERYTNFTPSHPPRTNAPTQSGGSDPNKTQNLPLRRLKSALNEWLTQHQVAVSYNQTLYIGKQALVASDITRKLIVAFADMNYSVNTIVLDAYLQEWIHEKRMAHLEAVRRDINGYDPERGTAEIKKFLSVLKANYTDLDVDVMKQMLWLVKRKLNAFTTKYEMMLVLTGGQGAGKSTALKDFLFAPLGDLAYTAADFAALSDQREGRLFSDHYIVMFDEMSGAQRTDMERTKQMITARVFKQRVMGTTSHNFLPMNATFFGTANQALEMLIKDSTGMRRFGELRVDPRASCERRWHLLKELDVKLLWKAVDENAETAPIEASMGALQERQEEMRDRGVVEWLIESASVEKTEDETEFTSAITMSYVVSIAMGASWSAKRLAAEWKRAGVKVKRTAAGTMYGVKVCDRVILETLRSKYNVRIDNNGNVHGF